MSVTEQELIDELLRLQEENPNKLITRDLFRALSQYKDQYTGLFGTFKQFRASAGLVPTRQEQAHLNEVARYVSAEDFRDLNVERAEYGGRYTRDHYGRDAIALVCSDVHDKECDPFFKRVFLETVSEIKPEYVVLNGDILDGTESSNYQQDPRQWDPVGRLNWLGEFLKEIRTRAPNCQIEYVEGNHEARFLRKLKERPEVISILHDLHGWTVAKLFGLDEYEVNYTAFADLAAYTPQNLKSEIGKNIVKINDQVIFCHYPSGMKEGFPGVSGHHHKFKTHAMYNGIFGAYNWHESGCGCVRKSTYSETSKCWQVGFMICELDTVTLKTTFHQVECSYETCWVAGRIYRRTDEELTYMMQ